MFIYIARHAWADARSAEKWPDDSLRELTPEGIARYQQMVHLLVERGFSPERIATSPYVRCRQTADRYDVTVDREGVYDERFVRKLLRWNMLLVCSGNTCRSPMAESIARQLLAEQRGVAVGQLDEAGLSVTSAGAFAAPGMPASPEAIQAADKLSL